MSAFAPNTPAANSKLLRSLSPTFTPSESQSYSQLLTFLTSHCSFATLSATEAEPIFTTLRARLTDRSADPDALSQALRTTAEVVQGAPPRVSHAYFAGVSQSLLAVLKRSSAPTHQSQALAVLAALFCSPGTQAVLHPLANSATTVASRLLSDASSPASVLLTALALLKAVLYSAPRQLRPFFSQLEPVLDSLLLGHPSGSVRQSAASLQGALPLAYPDKSLQDAFSSRLNNACAELDAVAAVLDMFSPTSGKDTQANGHGVSEHKGLSAHVLTLRYDGACALLCQTLSLHLPVPVIVALPGIMRSLCNGMTARAIDAYNTTNTAMPPEDALKLAADTALRATTTLAEVVRVLPRNACLPHVIALADVFEARMQLLLLQAREKGGGDVAGLAVREVIYNALHTFFEVLGATFIDNVVGLFGELLRIDVDIYSRSQKAVESYFSQKQSSAMESGRARKRRRRGKAPVLEQSGAPSQTLADMLSATVKRAAEQTMQAGVRAAVAIFANRGMLSKSTEIALKRLEEMLGTLLQGGALSSSVLRAVKEAALGGGAGRLRAEASPLLLKSMSLSTDMLLRPELHSGLSSLVAEMKSAYEAVVHPRGPPLLKAFHREPVAVGVDIPGLGAERRPPSKLADVASRVPAEEDHTEVVPQERKEAVDEKRDDMLNVANAVEEVPAKSAQYVQTPITASAVQAAQQRQNQKEKSVDAPETLGQQTEDTSPESDSRSKEANAVQNGERLTRDVDEAEHLPKPEHVNSTEETQEDQTMGRTGTELAHEISKSKPFAAQDKDQGHLSDAEVDGSEVENGEDDTEEVIASIRIENSDEE